ncbi:L-2-hydroxyglutarate oxidase [Halovenus marina]|uniref:L-2-hydroxyglutarate oxidase n=1 Tax=Halovenus marina TaxID=3396621 RepID=UPI003F55CD24
MRSSYDVVVIGAGCAGLAIAKHLAEQTDQSVCLLEKEYQLASHQSGRNSCVVFPGHVHPPGSEQARFGREGAARIKSFCREWDVPIAERGQLFVASDADEVEGLRGIAERATQNNVPTEFIEDADGLESLQPGVSGRAGLYCPSVATLDTRAFINTLGDRVRDLGVDLLFGHEVTALQSKRDSIAVSTTKGNLDAEYVVNAAGLHADTLAHELDVARVYQIVPFRGEYYELVADRRSSVETVLYPTPDPEQPYLGVHFMPLPDGRVLVGPNAALALGREAYSKWSVDPTDLGQTLGYAGFWRSILSPTMLRAAWGELMKTYSKDRFVTEAQALLPGLDASDFARSYTGIRAEPVRRDGEIVDGSLVEWGDRSMHVLNPISLTASLAYGDHLTEQLVERQL